MGDGRVDFRVWAPAVKSIAVVLSNGCRPLIAEGNGYFSAVLEANAGMRYQFRLDAREALFPDPASRFQPQGPHGPSEIVDPGSFAWTDRDWRGVTIDRRQIFYELHVGTFTREGTWAAAARELAELAEAGVTIIELMPVAEFDGQFGWGYDGVDLFAPSHLYGSPDDLRRFVDLAHTLGLGVILDAVYNHFGPSGNYLRLFSPSYFTTRYENEWGEAINFDGDDAGPVRELFVENAGYWIDEFHLDGLRLDATQQMFDRSRDHIVGAIAAKVRARATDRSAVVIAENEPMDARLVRPVSDGGCGLDALWNDDFHHSAMVALTGRGEAYYGDTRGEPQELVSAAKYGSLFQGQYYHWQRQPRGTPALDLPPSRFVAYLQNHDQVANSARGLRGHQLTSPSKWRAMTAALLLMPATPMLFQGQEFNATSPFLYFADFDGELAAAVRAGRSEFLAQFPSVIHYQREAGLDDPAARSTFERCKLDFGERATNAAVYRLHRDLIRLRSETPVCDAAGRSGADGAVLAAGAFMLRFFGNRSIDDHVLIVNLGGDVRRPSFAEPLLAPPFGRQWGLRWSSEDPRYGGNGMPDLWPDRGWAIPAECAILLTSQVCT